MKRCEVCGGVKPEEEFSKSYKNRCKTCVSSMTKFKRNIDKNAERMKTIYETPNAEIDAEIEKLLNPIDWEKRRYELAKEAITGIISNRTFPGESTIIYDCKKALEYANEMIEQLKKQQS